MAQGNDSDPVMQFARGMKELVNTESPTDRNSIDLDPPKNILVLRHDCEKLGIDVEREDIEKFIKQIAAFKSNGGFDAAKLADFLNSGVHGDRAATETKLFKTLEDVMKFQRFAQLVGGTYPPSKPEVDADYAENHQKITAATVLITKKTFENQTVTDEEIQKFYDGEKAKHDAPKPAPDPKKGAGQPPPPPPPAADPLILSDEKRTVKYVFTEMAKPPTAPTPLPVVPPLGDISSLPADQKKAKEDEHRKLEEERTKKETEANTEHQKNMTKYATDKNTWLKSVQDLSNALNAEDRGTKSFEDVAKEFKFEVKTASFVKTAPPEEIKKIKVRGGVGPGDVIFQAPKGGGEELLEDEGQSAFCFFTVTAVEPAALLPLDQVKQKISDKLKAEKVTVALKAAAESARSNMLEALKGGKNFTDAVEAARSKMLETLKKDPSFKEADAATMLTSAELTPYSKAKPLTGTPHSSIVTNQAESLNAGDLSQLEPVPDGLLMVYVTKKELPKHPDMEQQKKEITADHTYTGPGASLGEINQNNFQKYIEKSQFFQKHGGFSNPVLQAWFVDSRKEAETINQ
jgi:hypothetical protein